MEPDDNLEALSRSPPASPVGDVDAELSDAAAEAERVRSLRLAIDAKLREQGIYEQIRDLVRAKAVASRDAEVGEATPTGDSDRENVIHQVLESDVVQRIVESMRGTNVGDGQVAAKAPNKDQRSELDSVTPLNDSDDRDTGAHVLYLRLTGGKAFVDQLAEEQGDDEPLQKMTASHVGRVTSFFRVSVAFQKQRQCSSDVVCAVDPAFDEHFRFRIDKQTSVGRAGRNGGAFDAYDVEVTSPWEALCRMDEHVQIHLLKVVKKLLWWKSPTEMRWRELSTELVAVHRLDWRRVLCSSLPMVHFPVQLVGAMKAPVGTLDLRADVLNCKRTVRIAHTGSTLLNKQALEQNARSHAFFKYAKQWWEEYRSETRYVDRGTASPLQDEGDDQYSRLLAHVSARPRLIKLFAEDEEGRYRMVCRFLVRLRVPNAVRTPSEAARFVSLLPLETRTLVGGTRDEVWRSISTFLALKKGDALDHALLLASLLLGCGLDAFVCIGMVSTAKDVSKRSNHVLKGPRRTPFASSPSEVGHAWVLTRGGSTDSTSSSKILFWEAVSGDKVEISSKNRRYLGGYCSVDCVFNDSQFFANVQPRKWSLAETSFALEDETMWKRMDDELIAGLPFAQQPVYLSPPIVSAVASREQEWLAALRRDITSRRRANSLLTRWSNELSSYLLPALNAYELERVYDVAQVENEFFQQSVTRFVPDGHTFQGVPLLFTCEAVEDAVETTLQTDALVQQLVELHARTACFGVAVRCFAYADNTFATWVMLAASYQTAS